MGPRLPESVAKLEERKYLILPIIGLTGFAVVLAALLLSGVLTGAQASVIATLALIVLTGAYAALTYQLVHETRKSREQEIRPVLDFQAQEKGSYIMNVGGGAARKLSLTLELLPAGRTHSITHQSLPAGSQLAIHVEPFSSIADRGYGDLQIEGAKFSGIEITEGEEFWENLDDPYERLVMRGRCENIWGQECEIKEEYSVFALTEMYGGAVPPNLEEAQSLEWIAMEIREIRSQLQQNDWDQER